jgi:ABC-type multidrug transport system ATPase subunit
MLINGEERELNSISNLVGFVPQDDVMHRELTVRETLKYYARLRNRKTALRPWGHREIERRVQDVIEVLGIGHIVDSPIGDEAKRGISGGQRKRVNVGMEMVADPSLLFLDEPTSGLDSTTSYELVTALSNLALKGVNVIAVLHQPSFQLYEQFQNVLLLGAGGRTVYLGPANGALGYFTSSGFDLPRHMNPADFFMDVIAGKVKRNGHPDFEKTDLFPLWDEKRGPIEDACKHSLVPAEPLKAEVIERNGSAPFASQVYVFAKRAGQQHVRAVDSAVGDVFLIFGIGLILGFTYNTGEMSNFANTALMFSFGLSLGIGLATLRVFGNELLVYWREAAPGAGMGLSRLGYFIGKNIVEIPRIFLLVLVASAVFYPLAQLLSSYHEFLWQSFFLAWHVSGIAQFLSVALDGKTAQLALVILLLVFLLEAGVQTPFYKMEGVEVWISWLSPSRWYVDDVTLSNAAQVSVGYRLPPTWYKSGGSSLFAILKKLWMPEAIINSPHISSYRGLRRMGAEWAERQGLWYHYIAGNKVNVTSVWTPADLPKVNLNLLMSLYWGIIWRAFAFIALCTCNADKMGKQSWTTKVIHSALEKRCLDSCDRNFGNADEDEEDEGGDDDDDEEEEHDDENKTGNPLHVEVIMDPEDDKRIRTPSMLGTDVV